MITLGEVNRVVQLFSVAIFWLCFYLIETHILIILFQKLYYLDYPIHFLFTSCSFPLHSYLYFLFIAYSFLFILIHFFSFPIYFLLIAYHFLFMFIRFFHCLWPEKLPQFPKAIGFLLSTSYLKTIYFKPQINWGIHFLFILLPSVSRVFRKTWFLKGVVNKVWGLDG